MAPVPPNIQRLQTELLKAQAEFDRLADEDNAQAALKVAERVEALEGALLRAAAAMSVDMVEKKPAPSKEPIFPTVVLDPAAIGMATAKPTINKEAVVSNVVVELTKEQLGIGQFKPALPSKTLDELKALLVPVKDTKAMAAILPGKSVIDTEHRIHVVERGEIRRVARGLAIAVADGVQENGDVLSNSGRTYRTIDGVCYEVQTSKQWTFDGETVIEKLSACKGHLGYRKDPSSGNFIQTDEVFSRCAHQWALMFEGGYFVTFGVARRDDSPTKYPEIMLFEMASRVGDDAAREAANAQFAEWSENAATQLAGRVVHAQARANAVNRGQIQANGRLAPTPEVLDMRLPTGERLGDAIRDLNGQRFILRYSLPAEERTLKTSIRAKDAQDLADRIAISVAAAKQAGAVIQLLDLVAA